MDWADATRNGYLGSLEDGVGGGGQLGPDKHNESVFTHFYQVYILPEKFGVDKRRVHFSTLGAAGEMKRVEALLLLDQIPHPSKEDQKTDIQYFMKKMGWSEH